MKVKLIFYLLILIFLGSCVHVDVKTPGVSKKLKSEIKELANNGVTMEFRVRDTRSLDAPRGITVNSLKGYVFVSESGTNSVHIFNMDGNFLKSIDSWENNHEECTFNFPEGVGVDPVKEVLYVVDSLNCRILRFAEEGDFKSEFPERTKDFLGINFHDDDEESLNLPGDIYVDSLGKVYVVDTYNHRILIYDSSGKLLRELGGKGNIGGLFQFPRGVCVDPSGNIFVCEDSGRIQVFNSSGTFMYAFQNRIKLNKPRSMDIWKSNILIVCDTGNSRVLFFSTNGSFIHSIASTRDGKSLQKPFSVRTDEYNNIYILDSDLPAVYKIYGY